MGHVAKIVVALLLAAMALVSVHAIGGETPPAAPATQPAAEVMTAAARIPHQPPKAGEVLEMTIKALGNFEYDQEKGGEIPADCKRLNGVRIRVRGYMIPLEDMENITHFALVTSLTKRSISDVILVQHQIIANCPKTKPVTYCPNEVVVEGTLAVGEKREDGFTVSIFTLAVTSVKAN